MLAPQLTPTRTVLPLDGMWRFRVDWNNDGIDAGWQNSRPDTRHEMAVPASVNDVFADEAVRNHVGCYFYQRDVQIPMEWG